MKREYDAQYFMDQVTETYKKIAGEFSMYDIEDTLLKIHQQDISKTISEFMETNRKIATFFFCIRHTDLFSETLCAKNYPNTKLDKSFSLKTLEKIILKTKELKESKKQYSLIWDLITYSTLYSYFSYLFTMPGIEEFFEFIYSDEMKPYYLKLTRIAFSTPIFCGFVESVFSRTFKDIYSSNDEIDVDLVMEHLLVEWKSNLSKCPFYIKKLVGTYKEERKGEYLFKVFLKPLFMKPTLYYALSYHYPEESGKFDIFIKPLKEKYADKFAKLLFDDDAYFYQSFLELDIYDIDPSNAHAKLYDSYDMELLHSNNSLNSILQTPKEFSIYKVNPVETTPYFEVEQSMVLDNVSASCLRNILKNTILHEHVNVLKDMKMIRSNINSIEDVDIFDAIKYYLVDHGPSDTYLLRLLEFEKLQRLETIENERIPDSKILLSLYFNEMDREHDQRASYEHKIIEMRNIWSNIKSRTDRTIFNFNNMIKYFVFKKKFIKKNYSKNVDDIDIFRKMVKLMNQEENQDLKIVGSLNLYGHIMFENFTYHQYMKMRQDLEFYDRLMHTYIDNNKQRLLLKIAKNNYSYLKNFDPNGVVEQFRDYFIWIINSNFNPYQKANEFLDFLSSIQNLVIFWEELRSGDYFSLLYIFMIMYNPPNLFSNILYCIEYEALVGTFALDGIFKDIQEFEVICNDLNRSFYKTIKVAFNYCDFTKKLILTVSLIKPFSSTEVSCGIIDVQTNVLEYLIIKNEDININTDLDYAVFFYSSHDEDKYLKQFFNNFISSQKLIVSTNEATQIEKGKVKIKYGFLKSIEVPQINIDSNNDSHNIMMEILSMYK